MLSHTKITQICKLYIASTKQTKAKCLYERERKNGFQMKQNEFQLNMWQEQQKREMSDHKPSGCSIHALGHHKVATGNSLFACVFGLCLDISRISNNVNNIGDKIVSCCAGLALALCGRASTERLLYHCP